MLVVMLTHKVYSEAVPAVSRWLNKEDCVMVEGLEAAVAPVTVQAHFAPG